MSQTKTKAAPSSNWKELQKKLKQDAPKGIKRKRNDVPSKPAKKVMTSASTRTVTTSITTEKEIKSPSLPEKPLDLSKQKIGKYIAVDCEMVGVGPTATESALARVSIVNFHGHVLLDTLVLPLEKVTDFRTHVSGINPAELYKKGRPLSEVQKDVADLCKDRIVIGHDVRHDFKALMLSHPAKATRDTVQYLPFRRYNDGKKPSLKKLAKAVLGLDIQGRSHSSVEDAKITMLLYHKVKTDWDKAIGGPGKGIIVKKKV